MKYEQMIVKSEKMELQRKLVDKFSFLHNMREVYLWGTGLLGKFACEEFKKNKVKVKGFIDNDERKQGNNIEGITIYPPTKLKKQDTVIICSGAYPQIKKQLLELEIKNIVYYEVMPFYDDKFQTYYDGFKNLWECIISNKEKLHEVENILEDDISLNVLDNVLSYRLSLNDDYLDEAYELSMQQGEQYFDKCIHLSKEEVFVDCGTYIGDTTLEFIEKTKEEYHSIYMLEPDEYIMSKARRNTEKFHDTFYLQMACGNEDTFLKYSTNGSQGGGTLKSEGSETIKVGKLDNYIKEKPTYIKMDIEGAEKEAIQGMKTILEDYRPKIAVSVYHKPQDIFEIPLMLKEMGLNYSFYLRHYSKMYYDTVLYCIPVNAS